MKKIMIFAMATVLLLVASAQAQCPGNLVTNGDFEDGTTGITTDYTYVAPPYNNTIIPYSLWDEGTYTVGPNPYDTHGSWTSYGDHTTGTGDMLIVNAYTPIGDPPYAVIWQQDVTVTPGYPYTFTYWLANSYDGPGADLGSVQLYINDVAIGATATATGVGTWLDVSREWTAPAILTSATIKLIDLTGAQDGSDFAIDDICFVATLITVDIDIKPGSCPNPFNPKSKGSVPVAIVGTDSFNVTDVNVASLMLEGVPIVEDNILYADVTQPHVSDPQAEECEDCFDADDPANFNCDLIDATDPENPVPGTDGVMDAYCGDGYDDLVVKFDTQALADAIAAMGGADRNDCVELTLTGETLAGTPIEGSDSVRVIKNIQAAP